MNAAQLILGTDKRNPLFMVYADDEDQLHVFYGLELLEKVSADREDPNFKMLVGRLYNARLSRKALCQTFNLDLKTIRRWAAALRSRDAQELVRVLSGRRGARKLSPEIEAYVRLRWPELIREGTYRISSKLREEIQSVFEVSLSGETLRPLIGELKRGEGEQIGEVGASSQAPIAEALPRESSASLVQGEFDAQSMESAGDCSSELAEVSEVEVLSATPQTQWCDHAGLLMFAPVLMAVAAAMDPPEPVFKQWLASLLLGAINIEQTKFLNWEDMSRLLGEVVRFPSPQRQQLERVAATAGFEALARFNSRLIEAEEQSDFYFDPHTKHYTGEQKVLEGWCAGLRRPDKAMHSDFIHSAKGEPLYFETSDNFADLRQRFFEVVQRCRQTMGWPQERVLSWVVDRGIFGNEVFEKVLEDPSLHLITWEKGYQAGDWPPAQGLSGSMVIERTRNHAEDLRCYKLEYGVRPWPKNARLRQIVVQATDPKERTIQVAILSDDQQRAANELIELMFCRWLQENDFKYLDKHFGINQITSYGVIGYEELGEAVKDRQVCSAETKALRKQRQKLKSQQGKLLLQATKAEHQSAQRQKRIQALESSACSDQERRQLSRLRQAQTRQESSRQKRQEPIESLSEQLDQLDQKAQTVEKTESRLERMIKEKMVRLDPGKKRLMDSLRVIARNAFYQALAPFKRAYNNYRDDHDQFRQVSQSAGVLEITTDSILVHIMPRVSFSPQLRRVIGAVLEELNQKGLVLPDGSSRRLTFRLAKRSELKLSMEKGD